MPPVLDTVGAAIASGNNVSTPTTLTPALPAHSVGELLLAATFCRSGTPTVATPSGWTQLVNVAGTNGRIALFGKIAASGSESAPSIVWSGLTTGTSGTPVQAQCAVFSGMLDTITGITDVLGTVENGAASTSAAASGNAITTVDPDDCVIALSCRLDDVGTWTPPAGFTAIGSALTTSGADMSFAWAYQVKATPGSVAPADFGLVGASSFASSGILIALKKRIPVTLFGAVSMPITFEAVTQWRVLPKTETLIDEFNTLDTTKWKLRTNVALSGGQARLVNQTTVEAVLATNSPGILEYDFTKSSVLGMVTPSLLPPTNFSRYTNFAVRTGVEGDYVGWSIIAYSTGQVDIKGGVFKNHAVQAGGYQAAYNATAHKYLRMRENNGTVYLDTSPDGSTWTQRVATACDLPLNKVRISFVSKSPLDGEALDYAYLDNFNYTIPKMETFQDDFASPPAPPKWNDGSDYGWDISQRLLLNCVVAYGYISTWDGGTGGVYDLIGSYIHAKVTPPPVGTGTKETYMEVSRMGTSGATRDGVSLFVAGSNLGAFKKIAGATVASATSRPYDPVNDQWFRIREQAGTIYCDTSPDGISWTNFWSTPANFDVTRCWAAFTSGYYGTETASQASIDSVNVPQVPTGPTTYYGITSTALAFNQVVQGRRRTFSQIAAPFVFAKEVQGRRKVFGQIASPFLFAKEVLAQRKTFGQITAPFVFVKDLQGQRKTFGQIAAPFVFSKDVQGRLKVFGQIASPFLFFKDVQARRKTFGQILSPYLFSKDIRGQRKTFSSIDSPITIPISIAGSRVGLTLYGVVARPIAFGAAVDGKRKTFGQIVAPFAFVKDLRGQRKTFGQTSLPIIFIKEAVGREWMYGQTSMQTLFGKEVSGRRKTFGQLAFPMNFTRDLRGSRKTFGKIDDLLIFTAFVDGRGFVGSKTYYGKIDSPFTFSKQFSASRKTFGRIIAPHIFGSASQGIRQTFGELDFPMDLLFDAETGLIEAYGQVSLPMLVEFDVTGNVRVSGIILNDALALYLGIKPVEAVYTEGIKVWPSE